MRSKEVDRAEINKCIEIFKEKVKRYDESVEIKGVSVGEEMRILETVVDYIEELEEEKQQVLDDYQDLGKDLANNFISKQVIRDKIEELEEYQKQVESRVKEKYSERDTLLQVIGGICYLKETLGE